MIKKLLEKIERMITTVTKGTGFGEIRIHIRNGKVVKVETNQSEMIGGDSY